MYWCLVVMVNPGQKLILHNKTVQAVSRWKFKNGLVMSLKIKKLENGPIMNRGYEMHEIKLLLMVVTIT